MPDAILVETYMDNITRCYALCDRRAPEISVIRERCLDFISNLPSIGFGDVRRLFDLARANFAPVPNLKNLSDAIPLLNGERESSRIRRIGSPASATLIQRINRTEALKMFAERSGTYDEYMADPAAYAYRHGAELRAIYDYDNAPPPGCCAGLNELHMSVLKRERR